MKFKETLTRDGSAIEILFSKESWQHLWKTQNPYRTRPWFSAGLYRIFTVKRLRRNPLNWNSVRPDDLAADFQTFYKEEVTNISGRSSPNTWAKSVAWFFPGLLSLRKSDEFIRMSIASDYHIKRRYLTDRWSEWAAIQAEFVPCSWMSFAFKKMQNESRACIKMHHLSPNGENMPYPYERCMEHGILSLAITNCFYQANTGLRAMAELVVNPLGKMEHIQFFARHPITSCHNLLQDEVGSNSILRMDSSSGEWFSVFWKVKKKKTYYLWATHFPARKPAGGIHNLHIAREFTMTPEGSCTSNQSFDPCRSASNIRSGVSFWSGNKLASLTEAGNGFCPSEKNL